MLLLELIFGGNPSFLNGWYFISCSAIVPLHLPLQLIKEDVVFLLLMLSLAAPVWAMGANAAP